MLKKKAVVVAGLILLGISSASVLLWAKPCCTDRQTAACSTQQQNGSCPAGTECAKETEPGVQSAECGSTTKEVIDGKTCIAASTSVYSCRNSSTIYYRLTVYTCYCKNDWGWDGTCTLSTAHGCAYFAAVEHEC